MTETTTAAEPPSSPGDASQPLGDASQPLEPTDIAPRHKVGDAHFNLTLNVGDVTNRLDDLDGRFAKTLGLAERVAGIVTLGDLAATIGAASDFLSVISSPDSWVDKATRLRTAQATLAMVERAEQLARGA